MSTLAMGKTGLKSVGFNENLNDDRLNPELRWWLSIISRPRWRLAAKCSVVAAEFLLVCVKIAFDKLLFTDF